MSKVGPLVLLFATACVVQGERVSPRCGPSLLLRSWTGESDVWYGGFGTIVAALDENGDGFRDVVVMGENDKVGVRIYRGSMAGVSRTPSTTWDVVNLLSVASGGDTNRDGFDDLVVVSASTAQTAILALHVGGPTGPSPEPAWTVLREITSTSDLDVAFGDLDGDGFDDLVVGDALFDTVDVYPGSATGPGDPIRRFEEPESHFGASVAVADVNGDGFDDVLVGAPSYDGEGNNEGKVWLYRGSRSGLEEEPDWSLEWHDPQSFLGTEVADAGDVNGDGFDDVLVGSVEDEMTLLETRTGLVLGSRSGLQAKEDWNFRTDESGFDRQAFAGVGDVDRDGFDDVVLAATLPDEAGTLALFRGTSDGLGDLPSWTDTPEKERVYQGTVVAAAGDVDRDGFRDVIVGAPNDQTDLDLEGRAFVYRGGCVTETP